MPVDTPLPAGSEPAILLDNLHVAWDANLVLHGISAQVPQGQAVAITGANGSGKSTLLRALLGNAPVTVGRVFLFGHDTADPRHLPWNRIGYVPQRAASAGGVSSSALEVVRSGLMGPGRWWNLPGDRAKAVEALHHVGLAHRANDPMSILSGGQQQRVLIARALVRNPDLLIMDEPMAGIDANSRRRLAAVVGDAKKRGTTILVVLHELGELGPLLDREIHIGAGHITSDGLPCIEPSTNPSHSHDADGHHAETPGTPKRPPHSPAPLLDQILGGQR